ncbi:hypothetical protein ACNFU2_19995 [Chryseobacterium sp. PTM-20240506]|uniref:hypothetical protein n=1 Tax=Chryseobacterium sp. PTM-20240506 TaxID=3400631 RepID=UPI003AAA2996
MIKKKLSNVKITDIKDQHKTHSKLKNNNKNSEREKEKFEIEWQKAKNLLDESAKYKDNIDKVNSWFTEDRQDADAIRQWHKDKRSKVTDTDNLKAFEQFLIENKLKQQFEQSDRYNDYATAGKMTSQKLKDFEETISKLETQLVFSDLDNPASLAH